MEQLEIYERKRMELYEKYRLGQINRQEYLKQIRPIDRWIDTLETSMFPGLFPANKTGEDKLEKVVGN
jgi:hypothetical protein